MKRTRFDSEYDRVRRQSGLAKPPEFPEVDRPTDMFDQARVKAAHEDFMQRMAELNKIDADKAAEMKLRLDEHTMRSNQLLKRLEYEHAGVAPPYLEKDGSPKYSLSFLLKMGWSIENLSGQITLMKPAQFRRSEKTEYENYKDQGS